MRKHYAFCLLALVFLFQSAFAQTELLFSNRLYISYNAYTRDNSAITIQQCPNRDKPSFYKESSFSVDTLKNTRSLRSTVITDGLTLDTGRYEIRNNKNPSIIYIHVVPAVATVLSSATWSGNTIINDTLKLCKTNLNFPQFTLSFSGTNAVKSVDAWNNRGDTLYVNGIKKGLFHEAIQSSDIKSGDKLKIQVDISAKHFWGITGCFSSNGKVFTQEVTFLSINNQTLPRPIIVKDDYACPGDTIWLSHSSSDPGVTWSFCCYPPQFIANGKNAFIIANRYEYSFDSAGVSLTSSSTINGCSLVSPPAFVHFPDCGYSKITGRVSESPNVYSPIANVLVRVMETQDYAFSDSQGFYSITLSDRTYYRPKTVEVASTDFYRAERYVYDTSMYSRENNLYTYKLLSSDLALSSSSGRFRPGFTTPIFFHITNQGKNTNAGTITIGLDNALTFVSASKTPKSINGNGLTFDIDSLASSSTGTLTVYASLPPSTQLGVALNTMASIVAAKPDVNPSNNMTTLTSIVTGSYDPNDIAVTPQGKGQYGYISDKDSLHYIIRFQNMGTDTAFTVVVKAKIPNGLDFSSFLMKDASHPYQLSMQHDTIVWTFPRIKLPHKTINEPGSHGLIRFYIKQKPNNPLNTEIKNKAAIYFDYNAPVITNEVLNTVNNGIVTGLALEEMEQGSAKLYPNPNDGHFVFEATEGGVLKIYDALGNAVYSQVHAGRLTIDVSTLPKGIYYYQAEGMQASKKGKIVLK